MNYADYSQSSGLFRIFAGSRLLYSGTGYAGRGPGKNNPEAQAKRAIGPLPTGLYLVGGAFTHDQLGPLAFRLHPFPTNAMFGRSGFLIHGDSRSRPGQASSGCIVLDKAARATVDRLKPCFLVVHQGRPQGVDLISDAQVTPVGSRETGR